MDLPFESTKDRMDYYAKFIFYTTYLKTKSINKSLEAVLANKEVVAWHNKLNNK